MQSEHITQFSAEHWRMEFLNERRKRTNEMAELLGMFETPEHLSHHEVKERVQKLLMEYRAMRGVARP